MVDSVDLATMDEARRNLHVLLDWPTLQGIPLLILGNKNDLDGALTEEELIEELNLRRVQNRQVACLRVWCILESGLVYLFGTFAGYGPSSSTA